ncbi:MAG: hypothetical protein ACD_78C00014G0006 [uncultured bacterium (gcode 4)]|uniref:Uncharacterized protein n=1 Tax=uncultured bacterium (gcode 4) TaxID=1234023 RepID=K1YE50_9BACT|nr:MAG: hypothetical protein ACD_78C00014G0006 [uncultured bacterium (gcode 4)]
MGYEKIFFVKFCFLSIIRILQYIFLLFFPQ